MKEAGYQYDAFISYRHLPLDKEAAIRLQQLLESQRMEKGKRGWRKNRTLRVFRDQSELAASSNLDESIRQALAKSRYLILICSPKLQESEWCMEELSFFRQLHGESNKNIFILLIAGEHFESVPPILWNEDLKAEDKPLCADVRAETMGGMKKRLKREYLRLAAPIMGDEYEVLYERKRRTNRLRIIAASSFLMTVILGFSIYNMHMMNLIAQKQETFYVRQSIRLASLAESKRKEGDQLLALLLAEQALPKGQKADDRPMVGEALTVLRSVVLEQKIMEETKTLQQKAHIPFNVTSWKNCNTYAKGTRIAVTDFDNTYLYDTNNGMLLFECEGEEVYFNAQADRALRFSRQSGENIRVLAEGFLVETGEIYFSKEYVISGDEYAIVDYVGVFDEGTQDCYIIRSNYEEGIGLRRTAVGKFDREGNLWEEPDVSQEVLEKCQPYSYMNALLDDKFKAADYVFGEEEAEPEIAEAAEALQMGGTDEKIQTVQATEDGELYIFNTYWLQNEYCLFWSRREKSRLDRLEGTAFLDRDSGRIYVKSSTALDIYGYKPENFGNRSLLTYRSYHLTCRLSEDGKRVMDVEAPGIFSKQYQYYEEKSLPRAEKKEADWYWLRVRDAEALMEPLAVEKIMAYPMVEQYMYYITPDMKYVFWQEPSGFLFLEEAGAKTAVQFTSAYQPEAEAACLAMDREAERLVVAWEYDKKGCQIEIFTTDKPEADAVCCMEDTLLQMIDFSQYSTDSVTHMEIQEEKLLVCTQLLSVVFDLRGKETAKVFEHGNQGYNQDRYLTKDGLLFCTAYTNSPYCLEAVYDVNTGERLFGNRGFARTFQYNEKTGALAYQHTSGESDVSRYLKIAYRKGDGSFEEVRTVASQEVNMMLRTDEFSMDDRYVLLNGADCCEVYDIFTGEKMLSINDSGYALLEGKLYDMKTDAAGRLAVYGIEGLEELLQEAEHYLASPYGARELSEQEMERYYILPDTEKS